ncbi:glycosyltransferase family 2 protein [Metabacillus idriensis]|uniref:glycosyltransferase family 2 protein n=1 Tax=Metabacillus idriensis TaxID=324768 RepID=UPI003D2890F7
MKKRYVSVKKKFWISQTAALLWMGASIYISLPWVRELAEIIGLPLAIMIIAGIAYIPGFLNAFLVCSLWIDRQPGHKNISPVLPVTVIIAAKNEEKNIVTAIHYIAKQDYEGEIHVIVADNGSTDDTAAEAEKTGKELGLNLRVFNEEKPGKFHALNRGISQTNTEFVLTLDADTLLHKSAIRYIVARMVSSPEDVCAVAGTILARNSRENLLTKMQEWDYFLGIAAIKRLQGLYQGTLVAQGAFSLYKTDAVKEIGGWPEAIGEDIVLTWRFLRRNYRVYFEPLSVAFTEVPATFRHFAKQRSRWARGMIEALKEMKPWHQPVLFVKFLTGINFIMPYLDFTYTVCWIPGLILAFFGYFWIVGPMTLFVLPITLISYFSIYSYQKKVFRELDLKVRKNTAGFFLFVLTYQIIMSPVSVWGYIQEFLKLRRIWK